MIRQIDLLAIGLVTLLLLWAPLPFGGVTPWAEVSLEVLAFLALALALLGLEGPADLRPVALPAAALGGVALLGVAQALPWPAPVAALLSPGHAQLYGQAAALLAPDPGGATRLTVAAAATRSAALLWAAAAACVVAGAVAGRHRRGRRVLGGALLLSAFFQIFFGARASLSGEKTLWGFEVPISAARLRGTFFNPNHLAVYLELALPVAFAWAFWTVRRARRESSLERRVLTVAPAVLVWIVLFAGLAFTASRGGLLAAVAAAALQGALLGIHYRRWDLAPLGAAAAVVGVAVAAAAGIEEGLARLVHSLPADVSWGARRQAWAATVELWRRFPVTGVGLGAFRDAFPLVQPASLAGTWWHAHSGPLEVLATTGVAGAVLLAAGFAPLFLRLLTVLARGRRSEDRAAGLAAIGALVSVAIHESFDFGLTLPANALTLAVLAGAAASARLSSRPPVPIPVTPLRKQDRAREDRAAGDALDLEEMEPGGKRRGKGKRPARRRRKGT
ncbi:MAG TPA: O-antigen ligase family protein [Thermoanaerobaculia bacterium]|jgi:O-antigen ligase|nr:O-antigen ligase family protein [Thermoanaerobaculia bacterium]